ncbi:nucleotide-diphospho-sugar transferase [Chytridium lagenaria]|nr:nucleotide-diphospho-sugar transferase [Chytridium lagenaria]
MLLEQWSEAVPRIIKLRQGTEWALLDDLINKGYKDTCIYKRFIQNGQASLGNLTIFGLTEVISYQPIPANSAHPYIPNKIWTYWHDGRPPPVVLDIIYGWKKVHPDYTVTILTAKNLKNHIRAPIPPSFEHAEPIAFKADWVRLAILAEQGGIWMDATIIVTSPLTWLPKCDSFLFHLDKFTNNPKHPVIEPWFIATAPSAPYITAWFNELNTVFSNFSASPHEYHTYLKRTFGEPTYNSLVQLNDLPYYLTVTITAMKVIMVDNVPAPCSTSAEMEPYKRIVAEEWNDFAVGVGLLHGAAGSERVIKLRRRVWEALVAVVSKVEEVKGSIYEKFIKGNKKWVERQKQLKVIGINEILLIHVSAPISFLPFYVLIDYFFLFACYHFYSLFS